MKKGSLADQCLPFLQEKVAKVVDIWIKANTFETGMLERIRSRALRGEGASHTSAGSQEDEKGYYRLLIHHLNILCCICYGKDQFTEFISIICISSFSFSLMHV